MNPLNPHPVLVFLIEWGVFIVTFLVVFSPFIYLGFRKVKKLPVNWLYAVVAYALSFVIYPVWGLWLLGKLDSYIYHNYPNAWWIQDSILQSNLNMIFLLVIVWPATVFYSTYLINGRLRKFSFFVSTLIALILLAILIAVALYLAVWGTTSAGNKYL